MIEYWNDISFANKEFLYGLILIPILLFWLLYKSHARYASLKLASGSFFSKQNNGKAFFRFIPDVFKGIGLFLLIIAMARPQSTSSWQDIRSEGIDIVLAMDISTSMLAMDFKPDRIGASKKLAIEFIDKRPNDRIGLVVFAGESFTQCPLTTDHDVLKNLFSGVKSGIIEDGTDIGSGLATSINRLKESDAKSKVVILMTDGSNRAKSIPPTTAAEIAQKFGIRIYTIGVGSNGTAPYPMTDFGGAIYTKNMKVEIDEKTLKKIAEVSGGEYFRATSNKKLRSIYEQIDKLEKTKFQENEYRKKHEGFLPYALAGFVFFGIAYLLNYTWLKGIV